MIDSYFRIPYQMIAVDPLIAAISKTRLKPFHITLAALISGICAVPLLLFQYKVLSAACLLFSGYLDTLDGSLARKSGIASPKGSVLDITSDRIVEFSVIMGLFLEEPAARGLLCLLMLGSVLFCITTFLVVGIFTPNQTEKSFYYSPGIMERTEAFLFFIALILFPTCFFLLSSLFILLVSMTAAIRMMQFLLS